MSEPIAGEVTRQSDAPQTESSQTESSQSDLLGEEFGNVDSIVQELIRLRGAILELESEAGERLDGIPVDRRPSARNLLHYVGLRRHDIRELQERLVLHGLSSLGRCEAHVMDNLEAVLNLLSRQASQPVSRIPADQIPVRFQRGRELLRQSTIRLLGSGVGREPLIMVTMPSDAATDYLLVRDLLEAGMSVMRVNCAHDDASCWAAMISNLRRAEREVGRSCRVAMDLAGPKIRTGPIEPGAEVIRWKPIRDDYGVVITPVRLWISPNPNDEMPERVDQVLSVSEDWWKDVRSGETLRFRDAAGRKRSLRVVNATDHGLLVESDKTSYVTPKTVLHRVTSNGGKETLGHLGPISPKEGYLVLCEGDQLQITGNAVPGHPARHDKHGKLIDVASVGCTLSEVLRNVAVGQRVLLDDGKIAGVVEESHGNRLVLRITRARPQGDRLRADKGMNFPDTDFSLPALTDEDIRNLEFIAANADVVSHSFVRRPEDVRQLREHLERLGKPDLGVILKIENRQAFENLPLLLLEAMRCSPATGVMIARGDLAVECGWERLAEVQEEILWMAEAAHMPVVWATQVLEGLAKSGLPSRAEISDAAMGARAECVMLNKGPNIVETVRILHGILRRMQEHQVKKRATFRRLQMAAGIG